MAAAAVAPVDPWAEWRALAARLTGYKPKPLPTGANVPLADFWPYILSLIGGTVLHEQLAGANGEELSALTAVWLAGAMNAVRDDGTVSDEDTARLMESVPLLASPEQGEALALSKDFNTGTALDAERVNITESVTKTKAASFVPATCYVLNDIGRMLVEFGDPLHKDMRDVLGKPPSPAVAAEAATVVHNWIDSSGLSDCMQIVTVHGVPKGVRYGAVAGANVVWTKHPDAMRMNLGDANTRPRLVLRNGKLAFVDDFPAATPATGYIAFGLQTDGTHLRIGTLYAHIPKME